MSKIVRNIHFVLLTGLVSLITLTYHPGVVAITESGVDTHGGILGPFVMAIFLLLLIFCLRVKEIKGAYTIKKLFVYLLAILIFSLFPIALYDSFLMMSDFRAIAITVMAVFIGWQLKLSDNNVILVLVIYGILAIYVGIAQSFFFGSGLSIQSQYFAFQKNTLGPIIGTAAVAFMQISFIEKKRKWFNFVFVVLTFIAIATCALIRARAAMLSAILIVVYILYKRYQNNGVFASGLIVASIIGLLLLMLPESVKQFFNDSMYAGYQGDNIDSDRMRRNREAIAYIGDNILLGNLSGGHVMSQIHNYPINKIYSYGIFFSFPILGLYCYIIISAIKKSLKANVSEIKSCGYLSLLLPYVVSMAEPTFPFGPGTATVFSFILFGISLRNDYDKKNQKSHFNYYGNTVLKH